jgi:hypothetical protein
MKLLQSSPALNTKSGARSVASALIGLAMALAAASAPAATAVEPTIEFVVVQSDTLIGLSNSVLVSASAWQEVARLNRLPDPNRISPGQVLKIPTRLLRARPVDARVVSAIGEVRVGDADAVEGASITEGQQLRTGANGSAVVELADGSRVRVAPSSLAQVAASRQLGQRSATSAAATPEAAAAANASSGWFAGTMRVLRGSVEVFATKVLRAKPLEVVTPTAVVGVRGTQYRVALDDAAANRTHAEVLEGVVRFDPSNATAGSDLRAGFGAEVDASAAAGSVAKLLDPPDLSAIPARFERPVVHFALPADAVPLRVQVAADAGFDKVVSDQRVDAGSEVRVTELDDAQWFVRARRIDAQGIEGHDASRSFVLKARPEPPAYRTPRSDAKQVIGGVDFAWAQNLAAPRAQLQIAEDAAFTRITQDHDNLDTAELHTDMAAPGTYYWRVASVRPSGDHGPFGDPQPFVMRPLPEPPSGGKSADGKALFFKWGGRAEDRQHVELARDPEFKDIVAQADVDQPEWTPPLPSRGGRYYFRYRSVEPDGYVSPYSETLMIEVARDWRFLFLLLPALLLL